jgi:hypothetical protein
MAPQKEWAFLFFAVATSASRFTPYGKKGGGNGDFNIQNK